MRPSALKYVLVYLIPAVVAVSLAVQSAWSFAAVAFVFGVLPAIELFLKPDPRNLDAVQETVAKQDRLYDLILFSLVPIQWGLLLFFLVQVSNAELSWVVKLGLTSAFVMACGVLGINAAHELGHRPTKHEQFMAKALLLSTLYMHFFIEHNRGHHKHVSTDEDPASSRRGEWLYAFFVRTIIGSWLGAWKLEQQRLQKKGLPVLSLH
ncbi:MAG: fatty acid desaturase, partial [Flavobacteriales bacterium]